MSPELYNVIILVAAGIAVFSMIAALYVSIRNLYKAIKAKKAADAKSGTEEKELSRDEVLSKIEEIVGDDFCADLNYDLVMKEIENTQLKVVAKKLSEIYQIAHGHNKSNSCYYVHESWRNE